MVSIKDKDLSDFLKTIKDPAQKRALKEIATQKLLYKVYCKKCKGKPIAHILLRNGREVPEEQVSYEVRSRKRFDNEWGFKCGKCLSDSIMCEEERGVLPEGPSQNHPSLTPTPVDIKKIADLLAQRKEGYEEKDGKKDVDGFVIERVA